MTIRQATAGGTAQAPGPEHDAPQRPSVVRRALDAKAVQGSISFVAFLVIFLIYALWLGEKFTSTDARALDLHQNTPVLMLGLAVLVTLIAGQFDLSVASMATLTSFMVIGLKVNQGWPFAVVIAACLGIGVLGGAFN